MGFFNFNLNKYNDITNNDLSHIPVEEVANYIEHIKNKKPEGLSVRENILKYNVLTFAFKFNKEKNLNLTSEQIDYLINHTIITYENNPPSWQIPIYMAFDSNINLKEEQINKLLDKTPAKIIIEHYYTIYNGFLKNNFSFNHLDKISQNDIELKNHWDEFKGRLNYYVENILESNDSYSIKTKDFEKFTNPSLTAFKSITQMFYDNINVNNNLSIEDLGKFLRLCNLITNEKFLSNNSISKETKEDILTSSSP